MSLVTSSPITQIPSDVVNADFVNIMIPNPSQSRPQKQIVPALSTKEPEIFLIESTLKKTYDSASEKYRYDLKISPFMDNK